MSDVFESSLYTDVASSNQSSGVRYGPGLDTGDLRRKFNFGDRVSELSIAQDPFFRFVSKVSKKATDDPSFKFSEKRGSWHKRYSYVSNHGTTAPGAIDGASTTAQVTHTNTDAGDTYYFTMITDYLSDGNRTNVHGNSNGDITPGVAGTKPEFFIPGQMVKIPYSTTAAGASWTDAAADSATRPDGYLIVKVTEVTPISTTGVDLKTEIVSDGGASANYELMSYSAHNDDLSGVDISGKSIHDYLEPKRCYVIGSAFAEGSGYPETWKDQPYSTGQGQTQIWKTSMAMTNTARATSLKYESNEWARIWREKLIEHKYDIEQSLLFGSQYSANDVNYTEGAVDFISTYGNSFTWSVDKSQDDFLNDMSNYMDPRYNNGGATVFFVRTDVYNWLHKLDGYFANNLEKSANYRYDFASAGKSKTLGVDITKISTVYGDMNVARNIHLDGTNISMLGIDLKHCAYRPLAGNGLNRDTSVYVGVQTLENSGVDRRVDMILTEAGMQWEMPEAHAIWVG